MKDRFWQVVAVATVAYFFVVRENLLERFLADWPLLLATLVVAVAVNYWLKEKEISFKDRVVAVMGAVILGFCCYGFGSKFIELVRLVVSDDPAAQEGVFAVAPLMNYILASAGFLCLLGWATIHGMFRDIEKPKQTMLDVNAQLDAQTHDLHYCDSVLTKGGAPQ